MRPAWAMLLVFGLAGCATLPGRSRPETPRPAASDAADEVAKAQISQLQRQAAMAEAEIKLLRRQLASLEVEVERLSARAEEPVAAPPPTMRSVLPVPPPVDHIEASELEPVRIEPQVTRPEAEPEAGTELGTESADPRRPGASVASVERSAAPRVQTAAVPPAGQAIYDSGYTLYHQGRFVDAESSFQRFLQAHGNTELADNAQFWIGESRFARGDHMGAMLAFQEVLDVYPGGNKIADALLKLGDCLVNLDNREGGRQRYGEVLRRFPGSAAAAIAEERLNLPRD